MNAQPLRLTHPLWTPATWDTAMATDAWEDVYQQIKGGGPEAVALRLLCIQAARDNTQIQEHLDQAQTQIGTLTRGARMCALVALDQWSQVYAMRDDTLPTGDSPMEWFDSCNASFAVGMAAGVLGKAEVSYAHLATTRVLARGLGMTYREQHVGIELEAIRTTLGDPSPARIRQAMEMAPMTARRTHRSRLAMAEAHMALGDYTAALAESPTESDLRGFLEVLLGRPTSLLTPDMGDYAPLALALSGQHIPLPTLTNEPEASYGALTRAHLLTRSPVTAGQAAAVLAARRPKMPDQRLMWSALMWSALTEGATAGLHPVVILDEYRAALAALSKVEDVAGTIRRLAPKIFTMLAFIPDAHPIFTAHLMDVPLLAGNHLMYQGQAFKLPGRAGASVVVTAAAGERPRKMHPQERARFYDEIERLDLPCEPVNIGWVARAMAAMCRAMSGVDAERWNTHGISLCQNISGHDAVAACKKLFE